MFTHYDSLEHPHIIPLQYKFDSLKILQSAKGLSKKKKTALLTVLKLNSLKPPNKGENRLNLAAKSHGNARHMMCQMATVRALSKNYIP